MHDYYLEPTFRADAFGPDGRLSRLYFSKGPKGPSAAEKKAAARQQQQQQKLMEAMLKQSQASSHIEIPPLPEYSPPPPPPTLVGDETGAERVRFERRKRGLGSSIVAGETGGYRRTLLGGAKPTLGGQGS